MPEPISSEEVKPSWGDMMEDLDGDAPLPPPKEIIEGNTKKLVEYKYDEDNKCMKITRIYSLETRKVSKSIAKRKTWKKFGHATRDNPHGPDPSTTYVADDVYLSFTTNKEELEEDKEDPLKKLKANSSVVKCRVCKGDHWTTKCPFKDSLQPLKEIEDKEKAKEVEAAAAPAVDLGTKTGKYVPPSLRSGADAAQRRGESMSTRRQADEAATLRVTNLSEDACESDLQELFRPFGGLARVYLAKDKITNQSKGFAFVSYNKREDAARAIKSLEGFGYDHLILNVEWAKYLIRTTKMDKMNEVILKILEKPIPETKKVILSKSKKSKKAREELKEVLAAKKEKHELKAKIHEQGHVIPTRSNAEKEIILKRTATKGVVKLFNAVSVHQKKVSQEMKQSKTEAKRSKKITEQFVKSDFMNLLKSTPADHKVQTIPEMVTTSTPEEEKPSKWDVFREDFMLGASMKDWDKQNNEESNSEYDANSDSDVG